MSADLTQEAGHKQTASHLYGSQQVLQWVFYENLNKGRWHMPQFERKPLAAAILMMFSAPVALAQAQTGAVASRITVRERGAGPRPWRRRRPTVVAQAASEATLPAVKVQDRKDDFKTESTRSATRTETPLRDIPQFINEVPQALIRSQGATTLQQALRNVPGISYAAAEGGTQANQVFYLRGFPVNQDFFVDGVRDLGEYNRDLFATESIEVLKGPSALMFGRGGSGGLINQTSKVADLLPRKEVGVTFGSFEQKRATADLNLRTSDSSAVRLIALGGGFRLLPLSAGRRESRVRAQLLDQRRQVHRHHALLLLPEREKRHRLRPAHGARGRHVLPLSSGVGRAPTTASRTTTTRTTRRNIATFKIEHEFRQEPEPAQRAALGQVTGGSRNRRSHRASTRRMPTAGRSRRRRPTACSLVTRNHDTDRTRDNADDALINQTDLTWKFDTGRRQAHAADRPRARRASGSIAGTTRWMPIRRSAGVQAPSVVSPLLSPNPYDAR